MVYTIIFAGGIGSRMGSVVPKQFLKINDKPILVHTIEKFSAHPMIDGIVVVSKEEYIDYCHELIVEFDVKKVLTVIPGGKTGQETIYNGLEYLTQEQKAFGESIVLIHDGVRPLITEELITNSIECVRKNGNSIAVANAIETVIRVNKEGKVIDTVNRNECRNAKAPQCFYLKDIWTAHVQARKEGRENVVDSATLMSLYGHTLYTVDCGQENIKITTPNDYYMFKGMYENSKET